MGKGIKKLGISLLIVIFSGMGLYWYSSIEAHPKSVVSSETDTNSDEVINTKKEVVNDNNKLSDELENIKVNDKSIDTEDKNVQQTNESKTEDSTLQENSKKEFTVEDAKNLLIQYNSNVDYIYQGDETMFKEVLKDKGHEGYVFLPNVDGDIGFFVDKYNGDIYKFHPSGYMEKI